MRSYQGQRSSSVRGIPLAILATLAFGCRSSASTKVQPSSCASTRPTVVLPQPDTPISTTIIARCPSRKVTILPKRDASAKSKPGSGRAARSAHGPEHDGADDQGAAGERPRRRNLSQQGERQGDAIHRLERGDDARRMRRERAQAADEQRVREGGAEYAQHDEQSQRSRIRQRRRDGERGKQAQRGTGVLPEGDLPCAAP